MVIFQVDAQPHLLLITLAAEDLTQCLNSSSQLQLHPAAAAKKQKNHEQRCVRYKLWAEDNACLCYRNWVILAFH